MWEESDATAVPSCGRAPASLLVRLQRPAPTRVAPCPLSLEDRFIDASCMFSNSKVFGASPAGLKDRNGVAFSSNHQLTFEYDDVYSAASVGSNQHDMELS